MHMPSVLIELGFYQIKRGILNSEEGQDQMALQIAKANCCLQKKRFRNSMGR
jgi:N-acetylmuramoyl-L-alanine amidase